MKVKLWRRAFAASMSAVMLLGLTACGGSNESSDGIKTFTMFTAMPGSEINDDNDVMNIIAEKTGAKLKETWLTGQTDAEAIGTIIAGGEYPDFINGGDAMMSLYDAGVLVPWDDYLEKYPNLKEMYTDKEWDNFRQEDGKIYWANVFQNTYGEDRATTHNDEAFWIQARSGMGRLPRNQNPGPVFRSAGKLCRCQPHHGKRYQEHSLHGTLRRLALFLHRECTPVP